MIKKRIIAGVAYIFIAMSMLTLVPIMNNAAYARSIFIHYANNTFCSVTGAKLGKRVFYAIVKNKRWAGANRRAADELERNPDEYLK